MDLRDVIMLCLFLGIFGSIIFIGISFNRITFYNTRLPRGYPKFVRRVEIWTEVQQISMITFAIFSILCFVWLFFDVLL